MTLTDEELDRYARHIVLPQVGGAGQQRLKAARVAVVGAGGIGSAAIPALAGAGIGRLTIIDGDTVDLSNLQRQPLYRADQIGQGKALLAAQFVNALNPFVNVVPIACRIDGANAAELLSGHDLILDGTDNFATRLIVSETAVALDIPLVSAAAAQFQGQVGLPLLRGRCIRCG
jgi:molybdopterin/thiamine biosynthesis adenylyltransferase